MSDLNDRIAIARGWRLVEIPTAFSLSPTRHTIKKWQSPNPCFGLIDEKDRPDFTGTLGGVAGMLRILGPDWSWGWDGTQYACRRDEEGTWPVKEFFSPSDHAGDCVGEAYMSMKEVADVSATEQ